MDRLDKERHDLAKAEQDLVAGEERVTRQALLVEELRRDGHDTSDAEDILATLSRTLEEFRRHRELILAEIDRYRGERRQKQGAEATSDGRSS